ncbi:putative acyl-activating enzyme 19 isoform X3 [Coffea arabica]|uniref:Acyl-activating enzyme 19 isoform X3 n=1 Tax=Coffea arabica TaxID=13443 RepID=A0ABM4WWR2_COFAR
MADDAPPPPPPLPPELKLPVCCISHLFQKAATNSPDKIAVIHASGGAKLISQQYDGQLSFDQQTRPVSNPELVDSKTAPPLLSKQPPVYGGDECFTYSEILSAVNSLSSWLRRILDGADDPHIIKPQSGYKLGGQQANSDKNSESMGFFNLSGEQVTKLHDKCMPRRIGIYMEPSVEYIVAVLSVLRCGESFMPLDPSWPEERILSVVFSSRADLIIGCESLVDDGCFHQLDNVHWLASRGYCPVLCISIRQCIERQGHLCSLVWPCESESSRLFCYLMYTSGSTGKPKGVCGTEAGLLNRFLWMQDLYPMHGQDYLVFKTSISFIDHLQEFLSGILTTSTLVVPPFNVLKENILCMVDFLQIYSVNRLVAVPSLLRAVLLPLQGPHYMGLRSSLKLLVLTGEVLHLSLCESLLKLLPHTAILNLYGSTEVAGDCTYFDCKQLPLILENEIVSSVPIGLPLSNCDVVLIGENAPKYGEIYVRGLCNGVGYFDHLSITPFGPAKLPQTSFINHTSRDPRLQGYFKTGDLARQLQSGDFIFIGREDRTIKFNGQRIALEEIENTLREHPDIVDAAVTCLKKHGEISSIEAYLVPKKMQDSNENFKSSIRSWMVKKLPQALIPSRIFFSESFPTTSSGKVDYNMLDDSSSSRAHGRSYVGEIWDNDDLKFIQKVFSEALMVDNISIHDNFFHSGGNSVSAAYVAYNLGINMKLLYAFPTPLKLQMALERKIGSSHYDSRNEDNVNVDSGVTDEILLPAYSKTGSPHGIKPRRRMFGAVDNSNTEHPTKLLKKDSSLCIIPKDGNLKDNGFWSSHSFNAACSVSRCNKIMYCNGGHNNLCHTISSQQISRERKGSVQELWKVNMESCVDASPLIVCKGSEVYLFVGSHAKKFVCVDARSGFVLWEVRLEGRIESSAAVLDDFSQVVVGCYQGNIYFLHLSDGSICWRFQTGGEVKSQPVVDKLRHLVWCGSYDHNLYGLDYKGYSCSYKLYCGGSIFGAPALDEMREKLFVASTSGILTAFSLKDSSCSKSWIQDLEAPVFGSVLINFNNGNVICCLVDGNVVSLDADGSILWKALCGGPIFAGPCISETLPSQVLVCSRDGSIYSFKLENGDLLWQQALGYPITSSAYIDENLELTSDASHLADRLVCVCTSAGSISVLRINLDAAGGASQPPENDMVQEIARLELGGDIFSSPVMIGGKIFVGCRDDYVYCLEFEADREANW